MSASQMRRFMEAAKFDRGQYSPPIKPPHHIIRRYLGGGCHTLSLALHTATKLPLWGMFEAGTDILHHTFVLNPATNEALDIRGWMPLENVAEGSEIEGKAEFRPVSKDDITSVVGHITRGEMREASQIARQYLLQKAER